MCAATSICRMRCSRSRERRARRALVLAVALSACARVAPLPPAPAPPGDPLAVIQHRAAALHTLRAQFDAVARFPGGERRSTGVLIVRPPDDARLRLVAPFGLTVFDGLRTGGRTYVNSPLAAGHEDASLAFMRVGPGYSLLFGAADTTACRASGTQADRVEYWCGTPPTRWVAIDRATATVSAEAELENGQPLVTRSYGDYRVVDDLPLPYRIRIDYPRQQVSVDITVTRYELNPPLRDEQFAPPAQFSCTNPSRQTTDYTDFTDEDRPIRDIRVIRGLSLPAGTRAGDSCRASVRGRDERATSSPP